MKMEKKERTACHCFGVATNCNLLHKSQLYFMISYSNLRKTLTPTAHSGVTPREP